MMRQMTTLTLSVVLVCMVLQRTSAWTTPSLQTFQRSTSSSKTSLFMALDYNDPVVGEYLANIQPMSFEEVEEELMESGIRAPPSMNDMDLKLMLVEVRMRAEGKMPDSKTKKQRPATFSSKFEEMLWTNEAFEEFYNGYKKSDDHNAMNVIAEYINHPDQAEERYGKDYRRTLRELKAVLTAPPPVKSPTLSFKGFPANMGEAACKMTLEAVGAISEFDCTESEDFPILEGKVTYEDIEDAKKAVEQYNGMDMGMGEALVLKSV